MRMQGFFMPGVRRPQAHRPRDAHPVPDGLLTCVMRGRAPAWQSGGLV